MRFLVLAGFLLSGVFPGSAALAVSDESAIKLLEQGQSSLSNKENSCTNCGPYYSNASAPIQDWVACHNDLCPNGWGEVYQQYLSVSRQVLDTSTEAEIFDEVRATYREELAEKMRVYDRLLRALEKNEVFKDPKARKMLGTWYTLNQFKYVVLDGSQNVDDAKTTEKLRLNSLNTKTPEIVKRDLALIKKMMARTRTISFDSMPEDFDFYVQSKAPAEIQKEVNEILKKLDQVAIETERDWGIPADIAMGVRLSGADTRLRNGQFLKRDFEELRGDLVGAQLFTSIQKDEKLVQELTNLELKPTDALGENAKGTLEARREYLRKYLSGEDQSDLSPKANLDWALETCAANLKLAKQFYPTKDQLKAFEVDFARYKKEFLVAMKKKLSQETAGKLESEMSGWLAAVPGTYDEFRDDLLERLKVNHQAFAYKNTRAIELAKTRFDYVVAGDLMSAMDLAADAKIDRITKETCEGNVPEPIRDKAYSGRGKMEVGALSVKLPKFGNGTSKHEFAHLMSGLFSKGTMSSKSTAWYDEVKSCLKGDRETDRYVEEDFADMTITVTGGQGSNCSLLSFNPDRFSLKVDPEDTHSPDLYRVLHGYMLEKGSIPDSCRKALEVRGERFSLPNCTAGKAAGGVQ